ncbi:Zn(2)-C6 fungal-type domain-containing protein [Mycena indigotica]|uniref:Zn(2)-C6 fungal-type domain-containing protein n=1 Tax=Mycena indigotica TaxID=2126181 RepID=A0A8H6T818_9AGAR|nr:Zn(2)-C6 fungal-type domain-containing protein [Mycena indigotica]KAF7312630.1 Zn(2)-C6 fungal-type domain-containing protein [Mycena indigotica]
MSSSAAMSTQETTPKPAKFKTPTCVLCRKRKLRCDGNSPCSPCTRTRTPVVCTYVPKTVGQLRSELPKGGACITCRQRKRRCDGHFPCRTCVQAGRPDECAYREKPRSSSSSPSSSTGTKSKPRKQRQSVVDAGSPASSGSSSASDSRPTTPQDYQEEQEHWPKLHVDHSGFESEFDTSMNVFAGSWDMSQCDFSATSSAAYSPGYDYEYNESRVNLVSQHLHLSPSKLSALAQGDLSGRAIHPTLVHAIDLLSCLSSPPPQPFPEYEFEPSAAAWGLDSRETELLSLVRAALAPLSLEAAPDAVTSVQLHVLLHAYYSLKRDFGSALGCISGAGSVLVGQAGTIALRGGFCSMMGNINLDCGSDQDGEAEEVRAALAQVVFLDIQAQLVHGAPSSLDGEVYERFRGVMTLHNDLNPLSLRGKAFLALYDAKQLVSAWNTHFSAGGTVPTAWARRYRALIVDLEGQVAAMQDGNQSTMEALMGAHAALSELFSVFPGDEIARRRAADAARMVVKLIDGPRGWEWSAVAGVVWAGAARLLQL